MFSTLAVVIFAIQFASAQLTFISSSCTGSPDISLGIPSNVTGSACQAQSCVNSTQFGLGIGIAAFSGNIKITCASSKNVSKVVKSLYGAFKDWWAMEIYTDETCTQVRAVISTKSQVCFQSGYEYSKFSLYTKGANEATGVKYESFTEAGCTGTVNTTTVFTSSQFSTSKCIVGTGTHNSMIDLIDFRAASGGNIADSIPKGYYGRAYTWRNTIPKNATDASNNGTDASNNGTDASNNGTDGTDASNNGTDTSGAFYGQSSLGVLLSVAVVAVAL